MAHQVGEVSSPSSEGEGTPTEEDQKPAPYESNDEGEEDLMVSGAVCPFSILLRIVVPKTGDQGDLEALIDSGCTHWLMSMPMVLRLGI